MMRLLLLFGLLVQTAVCLSSLSSKMPLPWTSTYRLKVPPEQSKYITLLQNILIRSQFVTSLKASGKYDEPTEAAVIAFQKGNSIHADGIFGHKTASLLLELHSYDGYVEDGSSASQLGNYLYKVSIPVYENRSIETTATLYDADNNILHEFIVRTHGAVTSKDPIPSYDNISPGRNQFTTDGSTPTGLSELDLEKPPSSEKLYGPYPVNKVLRGMKGNSKIILPALRSGILMHTGEWPTVVPTMPNSHGCIHAHPEDIKQVWTILVKKLGVKVRPHGGGDPWPYTPQGILSVYEIKS